MKKQTEYSRAVTATLNVIFAALILLAITPTALAQGDDLQEVLENFIAAEEVSGAVLLVSGPDERWLITAGIADQSSNAPVEPDTRFYAASVGKMPVAAAILALVDNGTLSLNQKIWPLIKDIDGIKRLKNADLVTLAQLLNHTSGLNEYLIDDFADASAENPLKAWSPAEALRFAYDEPAPARPDDTFEYTNTNYVLLGHILAQVKGSLGAALNSLVFDPADMNNSSVGAGATNHLLARGYVGENDVSVQGWNSVLGDGPMVTDIADLEKFTFALMRDGNILSPEMLEKMTTGSAHDSSYGLGMGIDGDEWGEWFGHSGGYDGFEADMRYYPDDELALIYLSNGNQLSEESLLQDVADWYFSD